MQFSNLPAKITTPFANSGSKRTIPVASQIGITAGAASYTDGFPPLTFTPLASGGVPPAGQDFNGVLNAITLIQQWQSAGGNFVYDAAWSTTNNGYPKGAVLLQAGQQGFWLCTVDNNTSNPDTGTPTGWAPMDAVGITAVTGLVASNVTLTPAQYGLPIITLAGTLTANVQIIFPAIAGAQWLIVNNTTGAFTATVKTSAGTGQIAPQGGSLGVWGDGTNLNSGAAPGRLIAYRVLTNSGTYTSTAGTTSVVVTIVGGGGGGGGTATNAGGFVSAAAGGGAGGWAKKRYTSGFSGVSYSAGGGGAAGLNTGGAGGTGGTSSFASMTATGGAGSNFGASISSSTVTIQGVAVGGSGAGGDLNGVGGLGTYAIYLPSPSSGKGGASILGEGGSFVTGYNNGQAAASYGAGGSGACASSGNSAVGGGAGFQGVVIVEEYA